MLKAGEKHSDLVKIIRLKWIKKVTPITVRTNVNSLFSFARIIYILCSKKITLNACSFTFVFDDHNFGYGQFCNPRFDCVGRMKCDFYTFRFFFFAGVAFQRTHVFCRLQSSLDNSSMAD